MSAPGLQPVGKALAAVADTARPMSAAYAIADFLVPSPREIATGAPRIWAHLWLETYRMACGDRHERLPAEDF